jgi:cytochrome bd-type quinol oxidase subunit 2
MSSGDRLVLWLHIAFAIFTIGPVALAISSTPRYIRRAEVPVLRYLSRITMIFTAASLLVLVFGVVLAQIDHAFSHPWLSVSLTLFVVTLVLLILIARDQRRAIRALADAASGAGSTTPAGTDEALLGDLLWLVILVLMVWRP